MKEEDKTKEQLINELVELRQRITELETLEKEERDNRNSVFESMTDGVYLTSENYEIEFMNKVLIDEFGDQVARICYEVFHNREEPCPLCKHSEVMKGKIERWEWHSCRMDKTYDLIETPLTNIDGTISKLTIFRDISEHRRAEETLKHLNLVLRAIRNVNQLIVEEKDPVRLLWSACNILIETRGYYNAWIALFDESGRLVANAEAGWGEDFLPMIERLKRGELPDFDRRALKQSEVVVTKDPPSTCTDCPLSAKCEEKGAMAVRLEHGKNVYGLLSVSVPVEFVADEEEQALFKEVAGDIAFALHSIEQEEERKRAEEALRASEEWLSTTLGSIGDAVIATDARGLVTHMNHVTENLTGWYEAEAVGKPLEDVFNVINEQTGEQVENPVTRVLREGVVVGLANHTVLIAKDETKRLITYSSAPLRDDEGNIIGTVMVFRDITKRKQAEEQIKASLREKEVLLREIHHRVKNNLQVISGMLYLQSGYIKDKKALEMFKETQDRIKSMALIHDELYQSKDLSQIDVAKYIQKLATDLINSYRITPDDIKLKIDVHEVLLVVNTAVPFGLIISELVSNSLKHAFPKGREGEIRIYLRLDSDNKFVLIVSDNGVGFPKDLDFRNTETLGLQLVTTLVKQLNGTIELDRSAGTTFTLTFAGQKI